MGKMPSKAKRGKRRWIGLEFMDGEISRERALEASKRFLGCDKIRLFDLVQDIESGVSKGIVEVKHEDLAIIKERAKNSEGSVKHVRSVTMSGKIRLVRSRMEIIKSKPSK